MGPEKWLDEKSKWNNWVRLAIEAGIGLVKLQLLTYTLAKFSRFPMESGSLPEKLVLFRFRFRREEFLGKWGREPWSNGLYDKSRVSSVGTCNTFSGNFPCKSHWLRSKVVKFNKLATNSGTWHDTAWLSRKRITESDSKFARWWFIGPERRQLDKFKTCRLGRKDRALHHSVLRPDKSTLSRYSSLSSVKFWKKLKFGIPSLQENLLMGSRLDKSRVTNLGRLEISVGIYPVKPQWERFR